MEGPPPSPSLSPLWGPRGRGPRGRGPSGPGPSEVGAALLLAVVVELALPVHHVGGPAVELDFPLTLCLIYVV